MKLILALMLSLAVSAGQAAAQSEALGGYRPVPEVLLKTCQHYANRARFKTHDSAADLDVILADSCKEAVRDVHQRIYASPYTVKRARIFLERLTRMKDTVIQINMERVFGTGYGPRSLPRQRREARTPQASMQGRPVSRYGEYLIAREIGVIAAYRKWAYSAGFRSAALN